MCTKKELVEWLEANVPDDYVILVGGGCCGDIDCVVIEPAHVDHKSKTVLLTY